MSRPSPVYGTGSHGQGQQQQFQRQPPNAGSFHQFQTQPYAQSPQVVHVAPPPLPHQSAPRATPNPRKRPRPTSPVSRPLEVVGYENQLDYVVGHGSQSNKRRRVLPPSQSYEQVMGMQGTGPARPASRLQPQIHPQRTPSRLSTGAVHRERETMDQRNEAMVPVITPQRAHIPRGQPHLRRVPVPRPSGHPPIPPPNFGNASQHHSSPPQYHAQVPPQPQLFPNPIHRRPVDPRRYHDPQQGHYHPYAQARAQRTLDATSLGLPQTRFEGHQSNAGGYLGTHAGDPFVQLPVPHHHWQQLQQQQRAPLNTMLGVTNRIPLGLPHQPAAGAHTPPLYPYLDANSAPPRTVPSPFPRPASSSSLAGALGDTDSWSHAPPPPPSLRQLRFGKVAPSVHVRPRTQSDNAVAARRRKSQAPTATARAIKSHNDLTSLLVQALSPASASAGVPTPRSVSDVYTPSPNEEPLAEVGVGVVEPAAKRRKRDHPSTPDVARALVPVVPGPSPQSICIPAHPLPSPAPRADPDGLGADVENALAALERECQRALGANAAPIRGPAVSSAENWENAGEVPPHFQPASQFPLKCESSRPAYQTSGQWTDEDWQATLPALQPLVDGMLVDVGMGSESGLGFPAGLEEVSSVFLKWKENKAREEREKEARVVEDKRRKVEAIWGAAAGAEVVNAVVPAPVDPPKSNSKPKPNPKRPRVERAFNAAVDMPGEWPNNYWNWDAFALGLEWGSEQLQDEVAGASPDMDVELELLDLDLGLDFGLDVEMPEATAPTETDDWLPLSVPSFFQEHTRTVFPFREGWARRVDGSVLEILN